MPDSPGLVDFVIGLVNSVLNLPDGQVKFFLQNCEINSAHQSIKESCFLSFFVIGATALLLAFVAAVYQVL